jgi:hypothetical protein
MTSLKWSPQIRVLIFDLSQIRNLNAQTILTGADDPRTRTSSWQVAMTACKPNSTAKNEGQQGGLSW